MATEQELPEFHLDVLVGAFNQELDVFDHLENRTSSVQRLRSDPRAVAIVNAIVPPLEDFSKRSSIHSHAAVLAAALSAGGVAM